MKNYRGINFYELWGEEEITKGKTQIKGEVILHDFCGCDLQEANFEGMTLTGFDFSGADLKGANFKRVTLDGIHINNAEIGITVKQHGKLRFYAYGIALISGVISTYSTGYFLYLLFSFLLVEEFTFFREAVVIPYLLIFIFSAVRCIEKGIGTYFPVFLLATVLASFFYQSVELSPSRAAAAILGLSCFIGAFSGMLAQSQAIYLVKELNFLTGPSIKIRKVNFITTTGIIFGAIAGGYFQTLPEVLITVSSALLAGLVAYGGNILGVKAYDEKTRQRQEAGSIPFEYSIEQQLNAEWTKSQAGKIDKGVLIEKILAVIEKLEKERKKRLKNRIEKEKYSSVRLLFDSVLDNLKTSFLDSTLRDVTFNGTSLNKANFSPALISISPEKSSELITAVPEEGTGQYNGGNREIEDKTGNSLKEFLPEIKTLIAELLNQQRVTTYNISESYFGGGIAGDGGIQLMLEGLKLPLEELRAKTKENSDV